MVDRAVLHLRDCVADCKLTWDHRRCGWPADVAHNQVVLVVCVIVGALKGLNEVQVALRARAEGCENFVAVGHDAHGVLQHRVGPMAAHCAEGLRGQGAHQLCVRLRKRRICV